MATLSGCVAFLHWIVCSQIGETFGVSWPVDNSQKNSASRRCWANLTSSRMPCGVGIDNDRVGNLVI